MSNVNLNHLAKYHNDFLRDPLNVIGQNHYSLSVKPELLDFKITGPFWDILRKLKIRLVVSREYEHLVLLLGASAQGPEIAYTPLPHPSGIAVDRKRRRVFIAASRNPNQVYMFRPVEKFLNRRELKPALHIKNILFPVKTHFYPGSLYMHDLVFINDRLYANAVGHNAVVRLLPDGGYEYAWWPSCVEVKGRPRTQCNFLQLNSISGGKSLTDCFFTASTDKISAVRIGDPAFQVDGKGVVFSGRTRKVICRGLTRPHSARRYQGKVWLDNSGYGEFGFIEDGKFCPIVKLPGWTRGLSFYKDIAFVGVSRILPRFAGYAPGLDTAKCLCGIFAVDLKSGGVLAEIVWPYGNQIFALEWLDADFTSGLVGRFRPQNKGMNLSEMFFSYNGEDES